VTIRGFGGVLRRETRWQVIGKKTAGGYHKKESRAEIFGHITYSTYFAACFL